jgi:hypothetical protein
MLGKWIRTGFKARRKVYAGIVLLYLLYALLSVIAKPTARMDNLLDWFNWSVEVVGVKIIGMTFILLGIAAAALLVAEITLLARDFYSPQVIQLVSKPINAHRLVGSRLWMFLLSFLMLIVLDFPLRWPFYQGWFSSVTGGEIASLSPALAASDFIYLGVLAAITWILILTLVPLLTCLLTASAKYLFDLSTRWLAVLLGLGYAFWIGVGILLASVMPPLISLQPGSKTYETNHWIPVLLLVGNLLIYWLATKLIDREAKM